MTHKHYESAHDAIHDPTRCAAVIAQLDEAPTIKYAVFAGLTTPSRTHHPATLRPCAPTRMLGYKVSGKTAREMFIKHPDSQIFRYVNAHRHSERIMTRSGGVTKWHVDELYAVLDIERNLPPGVTDSLSCKAFLETQTTAYIDRAICTSPLHFQIMILHPDLELAAYELENYRDTRQSIKAASEFKYPLAHCLHRSKHCIVGVDQCIPIPSREPHPDIGLPAKTNVPDPVRKALKTAFKTQPPRADRALTTPREQLADIVHKCFKRLRAPKPQSLRQREVYIDFLNMWGTALRSGMYIASRRMGKDCSVHHDSAAKFLLRLVEAGVLDILRPAIMHKSPKIRRPAVYVWANAELANLYMSSREGLFTAYATDTYHAVLRDVRTLVRAGATDEEVSKILTAKQMQSKGELKIEPQHLCTAAARWRARAETPPARNDSLIIRATVYYT